MISKAITILIGFGLLCCSPCVAADLSVTGIRPIFASSTPGFGEFSVEIQIKNNLARPTQIDLVCLYVGLTRPGIYFKDEPQIQKQYETVEIRSMQTETIVLKEKFRTYHPETIGEIIVTVVGSAIVSSVRLNAKFHPESKE